MRSGKRAARVIWAIKGTVGVVMPACVLDVVCLKQPYTWLSLVPRPLSQISGRVSDFSERGLGTRLDLPVITLASSLILKVLLVAY